MICRRAREHKLALLCAYPYADKKLIEFFRRNEENVIFLLDSGAFTAWKQGRPIVLDDYCRFLDALPVKPWRYFTLDVIGDGGASFKNYQTMLARGYEPVPIFTRGEDVAMVEEYYKTSDLLGVGGLVGTRNNRGFVNGIMRTVGTRKVHWLGFGDIDFLTTYRPYMCDSSSWSCGLRYAVMRLYEGGGRFVTLKKKDFINRPDEKTRRLLLEHGVNPLTLADKGNWKNSSVGKYPIEAIAFRAFVKHQIEVGSNLGTKVFLAITDASQAALCMDALRFWRGA